MSVLLRIREVERRTGHSESEIYKRMKSGTFPRSVRIGVKAVGWVEQEIENYIAAQIAARESKTLGGGP